MRSINCLLLMAGLALLTAPMLAQNSGTLEAQPASISGTVTDPNGHTVPGITVDLQGLASGDRYQSLTNENGFFEFRNVKPRIPYQVSIHATGFAEWVTPLFTLEPGQYKILTGCKLQLEEVRSAVDVHYSSEEVAREQVAREEKQRILGFVPNFYVVYDPQPEPLTTKLKFQLALKVSTDPVTVMGVGFIAGIRQAANSLDFPRGAKGYGQRFGITAANGFTDIMIGGAILPSLLHQDPRYFYQGTGTTRSRLLHALSHPFVCQGDNGHLQPNYSSLGGDLASAAISNAYYPQSQRGAGLVLGNFALGTAERMISSLAQEFLFRKLTTLSNRSTPANDNQLKTGQ